MQSGPQNTTRVQVSRAASQLLWHAAEEDAAQQEADLGGDRAEVKRSGNEDLEKACCAPKQQNLLFSEEVELKLVVSFVVAGAKICPE